MAKHGWDEDAARSVVREAKAKEEMLAAQQGVMNVLIWSYEHNAWWAPGERGYRDSVAAAGRYTPERAGQICAGAFPDEIMVPEKWAIKHGRPSHHPYHRRVERE